MRFIFELIFISMLAFSSAFFIAQTEDLKFSSIKTVEALCAIGESVNVDKKGECVPEQAFSKATNPIKETRGFIVKFVNTIAALLLAGCGLSILYSAYEFIAFSANPESAARAKNRLIQTGVAIVIIMSTFSIFRLIESLVL